MALFNDFNFKDRKAILRVDFNVPLDEKFNITDTTRIDLGVNTIRYILNKGGKCVVMSHLGRPKGLGFEKLLCFKIEINFTVSLDIKTFKIVFFFKFSKKEATSILTQL